MSRMIRRGWLAGIIWTLIMTGVAGAQDSAVTLTLEESIAIALRQSVTIQSAKEGVLASEARRKEAFTGFLPKLSTTYNYTYNDPAAYIKQPPPSAIQSLTVGTQDNYIWSLDVRQPVFAGGRITANYDISRLGADASRQEELGTIQDIVLEVKRGYFNILKAKRLVGWPSIPSSSSRPSGTWRRTSTRWAWSPATITSRPKCGFQTATRLSSDGKQPGSGAVALQHRFAPAHRRARDVVDILDYTPYERPSRSA